MQRPILIFLVALGIAYPRLGYGGLFNTRTLKETSGSMEPAIAMEDVVVIDFDAFSSARPNRDDIVAFYIPASIIKTPEGEKHRGKVFVKRIIGLPGEKIQIKGQKVYINGKPLVEPYANFRKPATNSPTSVSGERFESMWRAGELAWVKDATSLRDAFGPVVLKSQEYFVLGDNRDRSWDSRFIGPIPQDL